MVALGSIMEEGENKFLRVKDDVVKAAWQLWEAEILTHVFAEATFGVLHDIPVYSSDASSWAHYAAIGRVLWWNPYSDAYDKTEVVRMRDYLDMKPDGNHFYDEYPWRKEFDEHLASLGLTYDDLMGNDMYLYRQVVNVAYYMTLEDELTKIHKELCFTQ